MSLVYLKKLLQNTSNDDSILTQHQQEFFWMKIDYTAVLVAGVRIRVPQWVRLSES